MNKIEWNNEIFKGMTRTQITEFKSKNKRLVKKQAKLVLKQAKLNKELEKALIRFNAGDSKSTMLPVVVGGVVMATLMLCTTPQPSKGVGDSYVASPTKTVSAAATETSYEEVLETSVAEVTTMERLSSKITTTVIPNNNNNITDDYSVGNIIVEESVEEDNVVFEDDFLIFDMALEMGMNICEEGFALKGNTYRYNVRDLLNEYHAPASVVNFFENYYGSEFQNANLSYELNMYSGEKASFFDSTYDGFVVNVKANELKYSLDFNSQNALDTSERGGVSKEQRMALMQDAALMQEVQYLMERIHGDIKNFVLSDANESNLVKDIKGAVENEAFRSLLPWVVKANII